MLILLKTPFLKLQHVGNKLQHVGTKLSCITHQKPLIMCGSDIGCHERGRDIREFFKISNEYFRLEEIERWKSEIKQERFKNIFQVSIFG